MPPNRFESEVESFLEGSHGDRTHIKRADHPRLHHYAGRYSCSGIACEFGGEVHVRCVAGVRGECGCGWGCVGGVAMGVAGVSWGADLVRMWCG